VLTVREAVRSGKPAAVVLAAGDAALPSFAGSRWAPHAFRTVAAFRWVPEPRATNAEGGSPPASGSVRLDHRGSTQRMTPSAVKE
jgi:hypothetical protein